MKSNNCITEEQSVMKKYLHDFCREFVATEKSISRAEPLQMPYVYPICAQMFVENGKRPDSKKLKQSDSLFGKKAGLFFELSGTSALMLISHLSMAENPEERMEEIDAGKKILREFFPASEALFLASLVLTRGTTEDQWRDLAEKAKGIYEAIKNEHALLTSGGDIIFSILMAKTGKDRGLLERANEFQAYLEKALPGTEPVTLSRVLALESEGSVEEISERFLTLYHKLAEKGCAYGKRYQLPMLGIASMMPNDIDEIVNDICEVDKYLARQDLYRGLLHWYSKTVRLMHATMIVTGAYAKERRKQEGTEDHYVKAELLAMNISLWNLFYVLFI
jgi:hypothetical protein